MVKVTKTSTAIGKNLHEIREKKGVTQEKLALDAGVNRAYVGYIERGERNPSTEVLVKLAKALNVSPKDLFD